MLSFRSWFRGRFMPKEPMPAPPAANAGPRKPIQRTDPGPRQASSPLAPEAVERMSELMCRYLEGSDFPFAFVGGCACRILGSTRETHDFNIVVPTGKRQAAIERLSHMPGFGVSRACRVKRCWVHVDNRILHEAYNVDILESGKISADFDLSSAVVSVRRIQVLRPALMLRTKVVSWLAKDRKEKGSGVDGVDISFLLDYLVHHGITVDPQHLDKFDEGFFRTWDVDKHGDRAKWEAIGCTVPDSDDWDDGFDGSWW